VLVEKRWSITANEMRAFLQPDLDEYFVSAEVDEITTAICKIDRPELNDHVVAFLIVEGTNRKVCQRSLLQLFRPLLKSRDWPRT
jgi:hypothetical protein